MSMRAEDKQYRFKENIRLGYVNIVDPRMNNLAKKLEYSVQAIIPIGSLTHQDLDALIARLLTDRWGGNPPTEWRHPLVNAEEKAAKKKQKCPPHLVGCMILNLRTTDKPGLVDIHGDLHLDPKSCHSGDYYRVSIGGHAYSDPTPGITFFLNNVQWAAKGEALSGRKRAEDEFQSLEDAPGGFE